MDCPEGRGRMVYELQAWGAGGSGPVKRQVKVEVEAARPAPQTVQLDEQACGSEMELRRGNTLIMTPTDPGGTGYTWEQSEGNPSVLTPSGPGDVQAGGGPGAGAATSGPIRRDQARLPYRGWRRPSEGDAPAAKQCDINATAC